MLGPFEIRAAKTYRAMFFPVAEFADLVKRWAPGTRVLEIGCGDGMVIEQLAKTYPDASLTGIDIDDEPGRLFRGRGSEVAFHSITAEQFAGGHTGSFDLIVICDVLHHVEQEQRIDLLKAAKRLLAPDGAVVVKEWADFGDRFTRFVHFLETRVSGAYTLYDTADGWKSLLGAGFGPDSIDDERQVGRRRNNIAFLVRPFRQEPG